MAVVLCGAVRMLCCAVAVAVAAPFCILMATEVRHVVTMVSGTGLQ